MTLGLAVALGGLTLLALAMLLLPLLVSRRAPASRDAYNLAVYRDQLAEIERDLARGVLAANEAEAARAEIARRILALDPAEAVTGAGAIPRWPAPSVDRTGRSGDHAVAMVAILLLPVAAWAVYWQLGSPTQPDQPFADRGAPGARPPGAKAAAANPSQPGMTEALAQLAAHLRERPDDLTGWLLLARSELGLGGYQKAVEAYRRAAELAGNRADIMGDWGEAQVLAAAGTVTPAARAAFEAGLRDPETAPRSRYYLGLAELQEGNVKGALDAWVALAADAPPDAEWLALVQQRIAQAASTLGIDPATLTPRAKSARGVAGAPSPSSGSRVPSGATGMPSGSALAAAAEAAAGASPEERQAMINAMVERLAARLKDQPDDVDGWVRLGRSYMVLNQPDKARDAYARALKLKPDDPELGRALAEATTAAAGNKGAMPPAPGAAK